MNDACPVGGRGTHRVPRQSSCILTVEESARLEFILTMTLAERRVDVALAWSGLGSLSEISKITKLGAVNVNRWITGGHKMPFGAAFRIADIFGVDAGTLLAHYLDA